MKCSSIESLQRRLCMRVGTAALTAVLSPVAFANSSSGTGHRSVGQKSVPDQAIRDAISKAHNFERDYKDDRYIRTDEHIVMRSVLARLTRLQYLVGYANFSMISFDNMIKYSRNYSVVGSFSPQELKFIEKIFSQDARDYGFFGEKVSLQLTDKINHRDVLKVYGTGHYLYKGDSLGLFKKLRKQIGRELILTSGIRSVVKQLHLFLSKVAISEGNLSRAARSLAPPGHSFHGIGDFDVGQKGLGAANFTNTFAKTQLYRKMCELGYNIVRYPQLNPYGVRYEPWHIKVAQHV